MPRVVCILLLTAILSCTANANLQLNLTIDHYINAAPGAATDYWNAVPYAFDLSTNTVHTLTLPDGHWELHGLGYAEMVAAAAGPWTLDMTTPPGSSKYNFTFDVAGVPQATFAHADVITPQPFEHLAQLPTFRWVPSRPDTSGMIYPNEFDPTVDGLPLEVDQRIATPLAPVPLGDAVFSLQLMQPLEPMSSTATRVSGVNLGTITTAIDYSEHVEIPYTVELPEPSMAAGLVAAGTFLFRRRCPASREA